MTLNSENYTLASEPKSNLYGALYSVLATDDPSQRKSMHYIGFCIGRAAYLMDKAESFLRRCKYYVSYCGKNGVRE